MEGRCPVCGLGAVVAEHSKHGFVADPNVFSHELSAAVEDRHSSSGHHVKPTAADRSFQQGASGPANATSVALIPVSPLTTWNSPVLTDLATTMLTIDYVIPKRWDRLPGSGALRRRTVEATQTDADGDAATMGCGGH